MLTGLLLLTGCSTQPERPAPEALTNAVRCPRVPADIRAEAKRRVPVQRGIKEPAALVPVVGSLLVSVETKNAAMTRLIWLYEQCRRAA